MAENRFDQYFLIDLPYVDIIMCAYNLTKCLFVNILQYSHGLGRQDSTELKIILFYLINELCFDIRVDTKMLYDL